SGRSPAARPPPGRRAPPPRRAPPCRGPPPVPRPPGPSSPLHTPDCILSSGLVAETGHGPVHQRPPGPASAPGRPLLHRGEYAARTGGEAHRRCRLVRVGAAPSAAAARRPRRPRTGVKGHAMPERRPNVIVVLTDQQRWDTTGVHGNPLDLTPHYDRMARRGTHVTQAVTPQPVCAPARAALQTGRYPTAAGVYRNSLALPPDRRTLAHCFGDAGYVTGYLGKWHLASAEPVPAGERGGYQHWLAANILEFTSDAYRTVLYDEDGQPVLLPGYRSDALFDAAIRFAADHHAEPFFLFLSLMEPHHQNEVDTYPAPEG